MINVSAPVLTDLERRYLQAVVGNPGKASSFYARAVRVSGRRAAEIRVRLVKEGYVRQHEVTGKRGRTSILLEPLPPAFNATTTHARPIPS